ncbi:MAG TPA: ATPase [Candidatus Merdivicinus excrementipullorum]|uniref:ATPase n=1 Tax=Candidatus Merdivicinus excrementipullorum TaxID=2840867 RepID=A0A9D1FP66_9FIRM|nr:ATPase [Candidatus Merdivicinus excrementipullorum]
MSIEKMHLVNLVGNLPDLEETLLRCVKSGVFAPEMAINTLDKTNGFSPLPGENPYTPHLKKLYDLAEDIHAKLSREDPPEDFTCEKAQAEIVRVQDTVSSLAKEKRELKERINQLEQALIQIQHLHGLGVPFDDVFSMSYVKVRFGRLPADSYPKLAFYDDRTFFFFDFDHDDSYYWGVYFAPATQIAVVDDIFKSLYFERIRVPDYIHKAPEEAIVNLQKALEERRARLAEVRKSLQEIREKEASTLNQAFTALKAASDVFGLRKYVAVINNRFYLEGFVPVSEWKRFSAVMSEIETVSCVCQPDDTNPTLTPPTRLKNCRFAKPFQMFVEMYGTPGYHDFDPTLLVSITYSLMFGIMFGDLGQGFVIAVIGLVLALWKKMDFGRIMLRLGVSSMIFGTIYGSVFGLEHVLDPMFHALGFAEKPIEVFDGATTNMLLIGAIGVGVCSIAIAMGVNIYLGFKYHNLEKAVFSQNGIAGMLVYLGAIGAAALLMLFNINVLNPFFIIFIIVIPLLCIYFKEPLAKLCARKKNLKPEDGVGTFLMENFFEMFEYLLSYVSNTMSFLRVGGFILSHAGMMAVVLSLSEMMSGAGSVVVLIFGNLFVMCLEGLIVGIQVLRLEFYEIFSRFYSGDGKPYEPAKISYRPER